MDIAIRKGNRGKRKQRSIGIDLGNMTLVTLSNGIKINEHESLQRLRYNLRCAKRKMARQQENSKRWRETKRVVDKTQKEIYQAQLDHAQKLAHFLTRGYKVICIEGDVPDNKCPNEDWNLIRKTIKKKAKERNVAYVEVAPYFTSQTCMRCGNRQRLPKEERIYTCPICGLSIDRDILAANNIRKTGIDILTRS